MIFEYVFRWGFILTLVTGEHCSLPNFDYGLFQKCQRGKLNEPQKLKIHEKIQNSIFFPIFNPLCFKPNILSKKENLLIFDQKNLGSVYDIFKSEDING